MKTLYISDLDGTLLDQKSKVTDFTANAINGLISKGMVFSFASARSAYSAGRALEGLDLRFPAVVYNGAYIADIKTGARLTFHAFSDEEYRYIFDAYTAEGIYPAVFSFIDGKEKCSYHETLSSPRMLLQREKDKGDPRRRPVNDTESMLDGEVFYFSAMGEKDELLPVYEKLCLRFECFFYADHERDMTWLEVLPRGVSKASAALELAHLLGCERIISFGDGKNDIPLFEVSDECYAVENAADELKKTANAVILSNSDDGVAKWLKENYR